MGREWLGGLTHAFLIRDPREMLLSLSAKLEVVELADTGLPQQVEIFELARQRGAGIPAVVDARDLLRDPGRTLQRLCATLGVAFSPRMLSWPKGPRETDGVWAKHWYHAVENSTGFTAYEPRHGELAAPLADLETQCRSLYQRLHAHRLQP